FCKANILVQIVTARIVSHSTFKFLQCEWECPKTGVPTQSNCISVEPAFYSVPPALCRRWRWSEVTAGPLEVGDHQHLLCASPKCIEHLESTALLLCIGSVSSPEIEPNPGCASRTELVGSDPPIPRIRNCRIEWKTTRPDQRHRSGSVPHINHGKRSRWHMPQTL